MTYYEQMLLNNLKLGFEIKKCTTQPLESGGLHFSSIVKEVTLDLENENNEIMQLHLVVKVKPKGEKQIEVNSNLGFKKEAAFYKKLVPEYTKLHMDHHLEAQNLIPKCYFASDDEIVLEDLRSVGFYGIKKRLDNDLTYLVLRELAKFHATGVALKMSSPEVFQTRLVEVVTPALQNACNPNREEVDKRFRQEIAEVMTSMKGFESFADPVDTILSKSLPTPSEPFATLLHNDLWNGNILFKNVSNSDQKEVKFIDFQTTVYNSPARDLVYFLLTSATDDILEDFNDMILIYYQEFIDYLSKFGCDTSQFTFEKLNNEVDIYGPTKLKHVIKLLKMQSDTSEMFRSRLQKVIVNFNKRGWLNKSER